MCHTLSKIFREPAHNVALEQEVQTKWNKGHQNPQIYSYRRTKIRLQNIKNNDKHKQILKVKFFPYYRNKTEIAQILFLITTHDRYHLNPDLSCHELMQSHQ